MDDLPTTRQELERKTVDFLEQKVHDFEAGHLDLDELQLVAKAVWSVTSGLVDNAISAMAADAAGDVKPVPVKKRFLGKGELLTFVWRPGTDGFAFSTTDAARLDKKNVVQKTKPGELQARLNQLFGALRTKGYIEV